MAHSVEMPELGESVTEGTVAQWLKKVGDKVEVDEPLLEVSTDKVDTEIPSPVAGVLLKILADEDDTVDVGTVIAEIGDEGEEASSDDDAKESADEDSSDDDASEKASADDSADEDDSESSDDNAGSGEAEDVKMPELGESVTEGTITQWLKKVGDKVEVDEPLLEVSTDKVDTEVPSPVAGTLVEILAEEDDTVDVGEVIARVGDGSAKPAKSKDEAADEKKAAEKDEKEESSSDDSESSDDNAGSGEAEDV
ncbi:biotin/lipoyl-containing protein, partial [uncultured Corynebacterium sp.]|uniref:biotin/lipoyl-containing protein n=1 Tax=uncultured Corynebacterium sp. TaxID=159447 RepID=UPI0025F207F7